MRRHPSPSFLLIACALLVAAAPHAASARDFTSYANWDSLRDDQRQWGGKLARGVMETAEADGAVRVLVELDVPMRDDEAFTPELADALRQMDIAFTQIEVGFEVGLLEHEVKHEYQRIPFTALDVPPEVLEGLEASEHVRAVELDTLQAPAMDDSTGIIEADEMWSQSHDGSGWAVAVLDTGVQSDHPFLSGAVVSEACYSANGSCPNSGTSQIGSGAGAPCSYSSSCDHGTHVAGTVAGTLTNAGSYGMLSGVAPGASIIAIQVFSQFTGSSCGSSPSPCALSWSSDQIAGLERVLTLSSTYNIASVNMSLGGGKYRRQSSCNSSRSATKAAIDNLRAAGIATVISSGNNGWNSAISAPGCISSAIAVGSTTKSDGVSSFSNHGRMVDLMAPGGSIASSVPGSSWSYKSGTSMAAPHVAGAWAVMKDMDPTLTVDEVFVALKRSGHGVKRAKRVRPRIALLQAQGEYSKVWLRQPNGGETLASGSSYTVKWFPQQGAATYTLFYSRNRGKRWSKVAEEITGTSYSWTVPSHRSNRSRAKFAVRALDSQDVRIGPNRESSDKTFKVEVVKVTSQNSGGSYTGGQSVSITWTTNSTVKAVANVKLFYRTSRKAKWKLIEKINGNPGSYSWTAPVLGSSKGAMRVKVDLRDSNGKRLGRDVNDANFSLSPS